MTRIILRPSKISYSPEVWNFAHVALWAAVFEIQTNSQNTEWLQDYLNINMTSKVPPSCFLLAPDTHMFCHSLYKQLFLMCRSILPKVHQMTCKWIDVPDMKIAPCLFLDMSDMKIAPYTCLFLDVSDMKSTPYTSLLLTPEFFIHFFLQSTGSEMQKVFRVHWMTP